MDVFAALADPVRRSLLEQLAHEGSCRVVDLTAGRGISRPAVSRHLRLLGEAGLVRATDAGRERHYRLEVTPLREVIGYADLLTSAAAGAAPAPTAGVESRPRPPVTPQDLDALDLEVRRTGRDRRASTPHTASSNDTEESA